MAEFYGSVMTNQGVNLLTAAIAGTAKIQFTGFVAGNGTYTATEREPANLMQRTALKSQKQSTTITSVTRPTTGAVVLEAILDNSALSAGYYVNEVGIYARDSINNTTPVLYAITVAKTADYMPPYNGLLPATIREKFVTTVSNSAEVTVVTSGAYADADDLGDISTLATSNKSSAVAAINETVNNTGSLSDLKTQDKDSIVDAINEIVTGEGHVYGFHISKSEGNPSSKVTYLAGAVGKIPAKMNYTDGVFDYGSWQNAFFMPKPCMLKYDGTVDYYLDPDDYSKKADGTASDIADTTYGGNAMMEWGQNGKKIWMKIIPDGDGCGASYYFSDRKEDEGYHDWPFHNSKGVSVDHFYTPIYNGSLDSNSKLRSISGQALMKTKTAANEITYAKANNPGADVLWNTELHSDIELINALLILMAKTTDTQTAFGQGLHTGGSETINDGFTTGVHNAKGLFFGTNSGSIALNDYGNAVKVFGMENWWGLQWRRYQGHIMDNGVQKVKNTYGTEDGSTASDYNLTGSGFKLTGADAPSGTSGGLRRMLVQQWHSFRASARRPFDQRRPRWRSLREPGLRRFERGLGRRSCPVLQTTCLERVNLRSKEGKRAQPVSP